MININIYGRIDEVDDITTVEEFINYLSDLHDGDLPDGQDESSLRRLFESLTLPAGLYTINGIEDAGDYWHGPGIPLGCPFTLLVSPQTSAFDLMQAAWRQTEAHGWPHINHVWFEGIEIDVEGRTINFSMGS